MRRPRWAEVRERLDRGPRSRAVLEVSEAMVREWQADRVGALAAEVAFYSVLGLFPGLLAMAAALAWLESLVGGELAADVRTTVVDFVQQVLTEDASETIAAVRSLFTEQRPGLLTFGLVAAVFAASRGFAGAIRALDIAYDIEEDRSWLNVRVTALLLALGSILVVALTLAVVVVGPLLGSGQEVAESIGAGSAFSTFWDWLRWPAASAVLVGWAATVYHLAPNHRTPWRWDLPGAVLAALAWVLASLGFRVYLAVAAEGNQVFGTLGGAITLMFWMYLLGVGLLLGGELNAILVARHGVTQRRRSRPPDDPTPAAPRDGDQ